MILVKPKKKLGQHFLKDENIAKKIVSQLYFDDYSLVLEIGPGMGVLTKFIPKNKKIYLIEIDKDSIEFLKIHFKNLIKNIIHDDFLKFNLKKFINQNQIGIVGNFPYNISSQILFKVINHRNNIPFLFFMFQKEVAERICHNKGSKKYGIISVIAQAFYETEFLFEVSPKVFSPPPKVKSAVIKLSRRKNFKLKCNEDLFFKVVKLSFQQRRKKIKNSLKNLHLDINLIEDTIFDLRPENLNYKDFIELTQKIESKNVRI